MNIRPALANDAQGLADLTRLASEGLAACIWEHLARDGESVLQTGARLIAQDEGIFSYRNTTVLARQHEIIGLLSGREIAPASEPVVLDEYLPFVRPLVTLEARAPEGWYISALAIQPEHEGRGIGMQLVDAAEQLARTLRRPSLSICVASENLRACRLMEQAGFIVHSSETFVRFGTLNHNGKWLLMVKPLS